MVEKRKSVSKHPYWCRRNRTSTPDILFPYLLGPELFIFPSMSTAQTRPIYSTARFCGSLSSASSFIPGWSSSANPMMSSDSILVPPSSGQLYTESSIVKDLSIRLTAQSVFPLWMDWCRPPGPSTMYMAPTQSDFIIATSSNPQSSIQRFFQHFGLPDYTLDSFSGRLLDVVSSMTFSSGDVQADLHHAITRLIVSTCVFWFLISFYQTILFLDFWMLFVIFFCIYIDCLIYMNQECVISLTVKST